MRLRSLLAVPVWMQNKYAMPSFSASTFGKVVPYATVMAIVGLIESLMTLGLVDELTQTKGNPNRECLGQGLANFVCGVLGGMGGCATIGQAMMNVASGARLAEPAAHPEEGASGRRLRQHRHVLRLVDVALDSAPPPPALAAPKELEI